MQLKLKDSKQFQQLNTLDLHTEGEPLRIVTGGYPDIKGKTILEKRRFVEQNLDHLRQVLMFEPRGHADMYGALITEPCSPDGDFGILFMHNEGYSSMCGHGIIATIKAMLECGELEVTDKESVQVKIDSPAGRINACANHTGHDIEIGFECVPSFVEVENRCVHIPDFGEVRYDIAFGGAYYAYVDADALGISCAPENVEQLINLGRAIKHAVIKDYPLSHPEHDDLAFLYGTIFTSNKTTNTANHSRHVCIFADGEVDRSPTGTGVSGRIALLHHQQAVKTDQAITIESIISSSMTVKATRPDSYFDKEAVVPHVTGSAYITGAHQFFVDHNDPQKDGFILR